MIEYINLIGLVVLLALGYSIGSFLERRHFQSIRERESALADLLLIPERFPPAKLLTPAYSSLLVDGNVVISVDYFKRFVAALRMLVGGRLVTYESLLERGRREAILRLKQRAKELGAESVFNIKIETSSISKGQNDSIGSIEVYAYGTAFVPRDSV